MRRDISIITERAHLRVPQEQERRVARMRRKGTFHGVQLRTNEGALLMWKGVRLLAQFDRLTHPQSHGWHQVNPSEFVLGRLP